ncbi:hypothetical protein AWB92_10485 [Mycobacterium sp. IEC1808]|uniref:NmrA family NAD(P)-binding protein n=1 Tax=Mycobacterium sp. IEC1808 TaxID=1743230 RepID=UPI000A250C34|nr:NmrA family NAD(P)-binding protein [Mycobacterium sp. IEC1808]ORW94738.1 hypothetical protein AWB92_10485 [Mycobacterium sp. IEC1808]
MTNTRVLVTGATGRIGGAVVAQLLERGVPTRALVRRDDARSARLRTLGAEVVVADMLDIQQVRAAVEGVDRLFFNPPYHPHALDSAVSFAVAARDAGVEAVVALGQWLASPEHPSLMTRQHWLSDKLFRLLPDTAHVAVDPGFFADNYFMALPVTVQLGVLPAPSTGGRLNAPPSNEDIARVAVGALLDPHRHDGRAYRPTGPKLLSGKEVAEIVGDAMGRRIRLMEMPPWMFMRAVHVNAKRLGVDTYFESGLRHYLPETALGVWEVGGPTTHVRDVAGVEPEDFPTIARRYIEAADTRRTPGKVVREIGNLMLTGLVPAHRLDRFDRRQQHPQPARPRYSAESAVWQREHAPSVDPARYRYGLGKLAVDVQ